MMPLTFTREERLKSLLLIGRLFREGNSYMAYPLRVVWLPLEPGQASPVQLAVSAPKRVFKTAVARNRIKRLMREAYRHNKHELFQKLAELGHPPIALMLVYVAREPLSLAEIDAGMKKMIRKFPEKS